MALRAFVAADLPTLPSVVRLASDLQRASEGLKMVNAEHLHLTLKFLGDTEEGLVPEIVHAMEAACEGVAPFTLRLRGTGAFPSLSHMNVLWVGIEGAEPLARIAKALDESLVDLGFPQEGRPWAAHVTLARVRGGRGLNEARALIQAHAADAFGDARIEEIRLKKSVLAPTGPTYSTVEAVRLSG